MEIRRIGENKFRCALTEDEIRALGFCIDDIIGDSETTQRFVQTVMHLVEEHEQININDFSPMVQAEILQNHTVAVTFGTDKELSFREIMEAVNHIMSRLSPEQLAEWKRARQAEQGGEQEQTEPMVCAFRFDAIEEIRRMCLVCFPAALPKSGLYKLAGMYYLVMDFAGFTKEQMRPFAFGAVEYDCGHSFEPGQIAHIMEQGKCIMKSGALEMLMQL